MAEKQGETLLGSVEEITLRELLLLLQADTANEEYFNLPQLDRIINAFQTYSLPSIRNRPPVLELVSSEPAAGKTHFLYLLIAAVSLRIGNEISQPSQHPGAVVLLDTENRFDVQRLVNVMTSQYEAANSTNIDVEQPKSHSDRINQALKHIHIFRPQSLATLLDTIDFLPRFLSDFSQHESSNRVLRLLAVDSGSAFFWQSRYELETRALSSQPVHSNNPFSDLVVSLRKVQDRFLCPVVATTWSLASKPAVIAGDTGPLRPLLPMAWQQYVTCRLSIRREAVRKFHGGLSLPECEHDQAQRREVTGRARFRVQVDTWSADSWNAKLREILRTEVKNRSFNFGMDESGIELLD